MAIATSTALLATAAAGAAATAYSAKKGAKAQEKAAKQAQNTQERMYQQNREDLTPYREVGTSALNKLAGLYGVSQDGEATQPDFDEFYSSPDYQFALEQGRRQVDQSLAARGLSNSGAALKELTRFGQGMASQQLGNYKNQLASLAGIGQTATNTTGAMGQQTASNIAQTQRAVGDARASSYQQMGSHVAQGLGSIGNTFALNQMGAFNTPSASQQLGSMQSGYSPVYMANWGGN